MPIKSAKKKPAIFRQVCELIPPHLVPKLARKHGVKDIEKTFFTNNPRVVSHPAAPYDPCRSPCWRKPALLDGRF